MLANEAEKKEKKSDYFKDILIALMVLVISIGCFFTYNPADAPMDLGSDGMNFATYPLGVASFLTFLGLIYLVISIKKYLSSSDQFDFTNQLSQAIKDNKSLYFKRLGTVVLLILFSIILGEINFMLVTSIFLFLGFYLYDRRDYIFMIILSILGGGFSYGLFVYFLKLPI